MWTGHPEPMSGCGGAKEEVGIPREPDVISREPITENAFREATAGREVVRRSTRKIIRMEGENERE